MHHQSDSTASPTPSTLQASYTPKGGSRWLMVAVALCGALAGASIVETLAALTSSSGVPISPDHLIAVPLALAGAVCGGFLAAVIAGKDPKMEHDQANAASDALVPADTIPGEPVFWQPNPSLIASVPSSGAVGQTSRESHRARRIRRAIRQRSYGHHVSRGATHTATQP